MDMKKLSLISVSCALFIFVAGSISFNSSAATYEETFTSKADKAYNEDINVWVYTSEFSERFAMPEKWIDNNLVGAYAVSFRVEITNDRTIFPHKGPDFSMPTRYCILDVYLSGAANIPWLNDQMSDKKWYTPDSPTYLLPQNNKDKKWRWKPVGLPHWGGVIKFRSESRNLGGLRIREYDKELYSDLTYISFDKSCVTPPKSASWIEFYDYQPKSSDKPVWKIETIERLHQIYIPASFMLRLYGEWHQKSRSPANLEYGEIFNKKGN